MAEVGMERLPTVVRILRKIKAIAMVKVHCSASQMRAVLDRFVKMVFGKTPTVVKMMKSAIRQIRNRPVPVSPP
jgi:hypothetical protein